MKPRLLDLFCGAGGAAMGYHRAGFDVVGVDIAPQKHFPFEFHQADAMTFPLEGFDVIHASPPCQRYSRMTKTRHKGRELKHPDLIAPLRERLKNATWSIIENVEGSPLINPIMLCGSMFGLGVRRHRLFECSFQFLTPKCNHQGNAVGVYGHTGAGSNRGRERKRSRNNGIAEWRKAMGINWMIVKEITQAIPPAYTEFIGKQLIERI